MSASFANCRVLDRCLYKHSTKTPKKAHCGKVQMSLSSYSISYPRFSSTVKLIIADGYTAWPDAALRASCKFNVIPKQAYEVGTNINPVFRGGNWGTDWFNNLLEVALTCRKSLIQVQALWLPSLCWVWEVGYGMSLGDSSWSRQMQWEVQVRDGPSSLPLPRRLSLSGPRTPLPPGWT